MNKHLLEPRDQEKDQKSMSPRLLPQHHRKLAVEAFLDNLGIPHLKEEIQTELPFKKFENPDAKHRRWHYALGGMLLGIGMATAWITWMNPPQKRDSSTSSFIAEYKWDGFRRVMPILSNIPHRP